MGHIIKLCPAVWVKKMSKLNKAVGENNFLDKLGGKRHFVSFFLRRGSGNLLGALYMQLPMRGKDTSFGGGSIICW